MRASGQESGAAKWAAVPQRREEGASGPRPQPSAGEHRLTPARANDLLGTAPPPRSSDWLLPGGNSLVLWLLSPHAGGGGGVRLAGGFGGGGWKAAGRRTWEAQGAPCHGLRRPRGAGESRPRSDT